jgi:beta-glucanase (GH16 family)
LIGSLTIHSSFVESTTILVNGAVAVGIPSLKSPIDLADIRDMTPRRRGLRLALASLLAGALCATVAPAGARPATAAVTATSCGPTVLKANGTPWACTLAENFDGTSLNRSLWVPQTSAASGFGSQDDCFLDDPDNISVSSGTLKLTVRKEKAPITCRTPSGTYSTRYTSGMISTYTKWSQAFGRFEFRAKFPAATTKGLHGALWMWPDNPIKYGMWPLSGEIDVAEVYSQYNDRAIPYVHYWPGTMGQTNNYCMLKVTDWHNYVLEWTATHLKISFDGKVCVNEPITPAAPLVAPQPFDHPFMLALTQGLGVGTNRLDPTRPPAFPATMQVDYVRAWK